jgi:hypothetical protein
MTFIVNGTDSAFEYAHPGIEQRTNSEVQHANYLRIYDAQNRYLLKGLVLGITCKNGDSFHLKYSDVWWLAGPKTGRFAGADMAINLDHYNHFVVENMADILFYEKTMKKLYYCPYETFVKYSFNHVQDFDGQPVQVVSLTSKTSSLKGGNR